MACRVGMSTNPDERIRHWKNQEGHTHSQILASGLTYEQAQRTEDREARERGCRSSGGGQYVAGFVWSVYHVWGGR